MHGQMWFGGWGRGFRWSGLVCCPTREWTRERGPADTYSTYDVQYSWKQEKALVMGWIPNTLRERQASKRHLSRSSVFFRIGWVADNAYSTGQRKAEEGFHYIKFFRGGKKKQTQITESPRSVAAVFSIVSSFISVIYGLLFLPVMMLFETRTRGDFLRILLWYVLVV